MKEDYIYERSSQAVVIVVLVGVAGLGTIRSDWGPLPPRKGEGLGNTTSSEIRTGDHNLFREEKDWGPPVLRAEKDWGPLCPQKKEKDEGLPASQRGEGRTTASFSERRTGDHNLERKEKDGGTTGFSEKRRTGDH